MHSTLSSPKLQHSWQFEAIGTHWCIDTSDIITGSVAKAIASYIDEFDKIYSRFRSDSLVTHIAKQAGNYHFPENAVTIMSLYRELYDLTDGMVTPLIGDTLVAHGYDSEYSLRPRLNNINTVPTWDSIMTWHDTQVITKRPVTLDVGAAGKGFLVDAIASILDSGDIDEYVVDASGDLRHHGNNSQTIGLEDPYDSSRVIGTIELQNKSLCASATNRRRWGDGLHHIFDPRTNKPVDNILATWVMADTAMIADGLATGLFFVEPRVLAKKWDFQYVRLMADGTVMYSNDLSGTIFT